MKKMHKKCAMDKKGISNHPRGAIREFMPSLTLSLSFSLTHTLSFIFQHNMNCTLYICYKYMISAQ